MTLTRSALLAAAVMGATIIATNAMTYVAAPAPSARTTRIHLAAFKNAGGCTSEAQAHCDGQPNFDECVAAYRRAHHC